MALPNANFGYNLSVKQYLAGKNTVYAYIKPQTAGSWRDDIQQLSKVTGLPVKNIIDANPFLKSGVFPQNNSEYTAIVLSGTPVDFDGSTAGNSSQSYTTSAWVFPLGVGTWYCSQAYHEGHTAIDLTTGVAGEIAGKPVYATKGGTVVDSYLSDSWGYNVLIRHDDTKSSDDPPKYYYSRYAHLKSASPFVTGDKINQGDKLGEAGNTGRSTGAHLHFQLYYTSSTAYRDGYIFSGNSPDSVNPNDIPDFPGAPFKSKQFFETKFTLSPYVTEERVKEIVDYAIGDGTSEKYTEAVNGLIFDVQTQVGVRSDSTVGIAISQAIGATLDNIVENAYEAARRQITINLKEDVLEQLARQAELTVETFVRNTIRSCVDDYAKIAINAAATVCESYISEHVKNETLAGLLNALAIGIMNTIVSTGASLLKGDITIEQAVNNADKVLRGLANNTTVMLYRSATNYFTPIIADAATGFIVTGLAELGLAVGTGGTSLIAAGAGLIVGGFFNWLGSMLKIGQWF